MTTQMDLPPPDPTPINGSGAAASGAAEAQDISPAEAANYMKSGDLFSAGEMQLTLLIFIFALVALSFFYFLQRAQNSTPYVLRIYVIIILIFGTLLVVSSAYSTSQIAPVVGFFGTIAGYLVGRNEKNEAS